MARRVRPRFFAMTRYFARLRHAPVIMTQRVTRACYARVELCHLRADDIPRTGKQAPLCSVCGKLKEKYCKSHGECIGPKRGLLSMVTNNSCGLRVDLGLL